MVRVTHLYFGANYKCISKVLVQITRVIDILGWFWCKLTTAELSLYSHNNNVFRYGIQNEPLAKDYFESKLGTKILPCGLFVDKNLPFLYDVQWWTFTT